MGDNLIAKDATVCLNPEELVAGLPLIRLLGKTGLPLVSFFGSVRVKPVWAFVVMMLVHGIFFTITCESLSIQFEWPQGVVCYPKARRTPKWWLGCHREILLS